jgi:hypothetical protein
MGGVDHAEGRIEVALVVAADFRRQKDGMGVAYALAAFEAYGMCAHFLGVGDSQVAEGKKGPPGK